MGEVHSGMITSGDGAVLIERVRSGLDLMASHGSGPRCRVTLTFAQSLDGCISAAAGVATAISNPYSRALSHHLRALHDGILVGVNTVLVDDPQLTVRECEGDDPRPIVIDSQLRTPVCARLLRRRDGIRPIIATAQDASPRREAALTGAGATVLRFSRDDRGGVDLQSVLGRLPEEGVQTLMVEGGARIITTFLRESLADQIVLTISPVLLGGVRAVVSLDDVPEERRPRLENVHCESVSGDLLLYGKLGGAAT